MKKINLTITDEVFEDLKEYMFCKLLASPDSGTLPNQVINKLIKVIDEGKLEYTLSYKEKKDD